MKSLSGKSLKQRILNRIKIHSFCWEWQGSKSKRGYGKITTGSRSDGSRANREAHRVSYEAFIGEVPVGLVIDHLCRNPSCVNPSHLEAVTTQENIRRGTVGKNQKEKTHCPQGHPYAGANLAIYRSARVCRTCYRERNHKIYTLQQERNA